MPSLDARLLALETRHDDHAKPLPDLVDDSTSDAEMARHRQHGREVFRMSDPAFIDLFV